MEKFSHISWGFTTKAFTVTMEEMHKKKESKGSRNKDFVMKFSDKSKYSYIII